MPKKKTNKSAAKRFRVTGKGKIKFKRPNTGHLMGSKSRKRKRQLRHSGVLSGSEMGRVRELIYV